MYEYIIYIHIYNYVYLYIQGRNLARIYSIICAVNQLEWGGYYNVYICISEHAHMYVFISTYTTWQNPA